MKGKALPQNNGFVRYHREWTTTFNGNPFSNYADIYKNPNNGIVFLSLRVHSPNAPSNAWSVFYTIPDGFRPFRDIEAENKNDASNDNTEVKISTDGKVNCWRAGYPIMIGQWMYFEKGYMESQQITDL
jgi:hypothetical protein